jgi:threonine/homoserine/homoserine lactone efflux protein
MHIFPFLLVAAVVVITPGIDMALVTRNALLHGRSSALATAWGVSTGTVLWTIAATFGLAAIVQASAATFAMIKFAGALYLAYLGLQALRGSRRREDEPVAIAARPVQSARAAFRQGVLSNTLNPKIAIFFTSLLPQFIGSDSPSACRLLALGGLFNLLGVLWLTGYALAATRGRRLLQRPRVRAALDSVSGVVLLGLGVRLALERRG